MRSRPATPTAVIRYTTDGTPPTLENGETYEDSIRIARTTIVRAAAFREGYRESNADTQSYFFLEDVIRQSPRSTIDSGFPSTWTTTSPDYGMDPAIVGQDGNDRFQGKYAASIRDDLLSVPTLSLALPVEDLFGPRGIYSNSSSHGIQWERATSAELIHPDGSEGFQVNCGIRVHGGAFRSHGLTRKHSFRLLFKGIYGPTKLRYPMFGSEASDRLDGFVLRANSNDGYQWQAAGAKPLYIRDSMGRETQLALGNVASQEAFVHLYLNGIYWGLYNAVERPDSSFCATYFGGQKTEWDSISTDFDAQEGDTQAWNTMRGLLRSVNSDAGYMAIQGLNPDGSPNPELPVYIDVQNVIDYMITNLYVGNTDWPHKNFWFGRRRVDSTGFKFYMWDSEWSLGLRSDVGTNQTTVSNGVAEPYSRLRLHPEFRVQFGDTLHRHFFNGGALYVDPNQSEWDPEHPGRNVPAARFVRLAERIENAMVAESARWGDQHGTRYTRDEHWARERDLLLRTYFHGDQPAFCSSFAG